MNKVNKLTLTAILLAIVSLFSCSPNDNGSSGGSMDKYTHCVYVEQEFCLTGSFSSCEGGGMPSNSCPYSSGSTIGGLSSSGGNGYLSSSSENTSINHDYYCVVELVFNGEVISRLCMKNYENIGLDCNVYNDGNNSGRLSDSCPSGYSCTDFSNNTTKSCNNSSELSSSSVAASSSSSSANLYSSSSSLFSSSSITIISGTFTDSRDNQTYKWVKIGEQTWMAENLNFNATGSKCYNNLSTNCNTYGRLYDWATAMKINSTYNSDSYGSSLVEKHKGICPDGWHLSSRAEWIQLLNYVYIEANEKTEKCLDCGKHLKATSGWNEYNGASGGLDSYGFTALPGGFSSSDAGENGYWWTTIENLSASAYYMHMKYNSNAVFRDTNNKTRFQSVRCIKD